MPRFHFPIVEDGRVITDEEGQEFTEKEMLFAGKQWKPALQLPGMRSSEGARARSSMCEKVTSSLTVDR